jgi:hypothetical protein
MPPKLGPQHATGASKPHTGYPESSPSLVTKGPASGPFGTKKGGKTRRRRRRSTRRRHH